MIRPQDLSNGSPGENSGRTAGRPLFSVFPKWPTLSIQEIIPVFLTLLIPKLIENETYFILYTYYTIIHNNHPFLLHQQKKTHPNISDVLTPSGVFEAVY